MPEITFGTTTCRWKETKFGGFDSDCGKEVVIRDEYEFENLPEFTFCPYCGKPLEKVLYEPPAEPPKAPVVINFVVDPVPAMIWVNDVYLGVSPVTLTEVMPGDMRVKAMATGFKIWEWKYTNIKYGARLSIAIGLDKMEDPQ